MNPRFCSLLTLFLLSASLPAQEKAVERLKRDLMFLASDECEGRGPGTKGIDLAADYIAQQFVKAGLKPGLADKGYFQPFTISGYSRQENPSRLALKGPAGEENILKAGMDFAPLGLSGPGKVSTPLVFAGYGTTAKDIKYDDYEGLDVKGKIVVVLRRLPRWDSKDKPFDGKNRDKHAALVTKIANAQSHGAAGVILVNDFSEATSKTPDKIIDFDELAYETPAAIPVMQMKRDLLDKITQDALKKPLHDIEKAIDADLKPQSAPLSGWTASVESGVVRAKLNVKNVVGVLEGQGPLAKETVVIGAHYDHLGWGGPGSLAKGAKAIHHGADDNASGTAALMEIARHFGAMKEREGRRLVFIAFSGEERGLLGSKHYVQEPLFPLDGTTSMFNLDMVGRLRATGGKDRLHVEGAGTSKAFAKLIEETNDPNALELKFAKELMPNSDHFSFYNKKIPIIFFWTGNHSEYHRPTDTSDRINYPGMEHIVDLTAKLIDKLAKQDTRPDFVSIPVVGGMGKGGAPRLGIVPSYEEGRKGLLVDGVSAGGPAETAGLKSGDVIVEIAGQPIADINNYLVVMRSQKAGRAIDITLERGGKRVTLKVTPQ